MSANDRIGTCKLCLRTKELRRSHIIPNAVFRRMYRDGSGKGIRIIGDVTTPNALTSNTWSEYLLCGDCEKHLNDNLERKALLVLSSTKTKWSSLHEHGVTLQNYNLAEFGNFFISILWRAAVARSEEFEKIRLPDDIAEILRSHLLNQPLHPCKLFSIRIWSLFDPVGHTPSKLIKNVTMAPTFTCEGSRRITFELLLLGVYVQLEVPYIKAKHRDNAYLDYKKNVFLIPRRSIFNIESLTRVTLLGLKKEDAQ